MYILLDFPFFRQRRKTVGGLWSETGINRESERKRETNRNERMGKKTSSQI